MQCARCQHENHEARRFCSRCGGALALACASCGFTNDPSDEFCGGCGVPLRVPPPGASSRFGSSEVEIPKHLAEKILTSRAALEGERKQVTVLFADTKGSTELLADRDPEDARRILDPVLESMMEAVHRYEGIVNQVMGDGIMALFGAPIAREDHAVCACYAALRMQERIGRYGDELQRSGGVPIQIRVGLHSGEVVVRSIGSDLRMDYSAVGQTTVLAARMEQLARPGSTLMTRDSLALVEGYVEVRPLGPVSVKGLGAAVEVYELTGAGPARSRLQAAVARGLTRFVGRSAEMEQLRRALEKAGQGHGQIVAVVGEPGIGKSRLFHELTRSRGTSGWLVLETGALSYGGTTPFLPLIDLLKAYFHVEDRDDERRIREKVSGKLAVLDQSLMSSVVAFLALLGVSITDPEWQSLDPLQRQRRTLEAGRRLVLRESLIQPLVIVFEDLHWIDSDSQAFLDSLIEGLPSARVLFLVNYRPEYQHGWGSKSYYAQLRIDPLPLETADELLRALLGEQPELDSLKRFLIGRTEGNPFFLEESVRTLVETGVLVGERGAFRPGRPFEDVQVPATVQAILASRIDRLSADDKRLLQSAAVIGKDVPFALLQTIAELSEEALRLALAHLQAAELLHESRLFPDLEYTFKHALTHDVAYRSVLSDRRRALHRRVLAALEQREEGQGREYVERLAHHALGGEEWDRAARYLHEAGEKALATERYAAAVAFQEEAIRAIERLGDAADRALQLDAYLELWAARASFPGYAPGYDVLRDLGERVEALAVALGDGSRLARLRVCQAQAEALDWFEPRSLGPALAHAREADQLADPSDVRTRSYARFIAGAACRDLGRYDEALAAFDSGIVLLYAPHGEVGLIEPIRVSLCAWRAEALAARGDFAAAIASATQGLDVANRIGHVNSMILASGFLGYVLLVRGDVEAAIPILRRGLGVAEEHGYMGNRNTLYLGYALLLFGQRDEGLRTLERATERLAAVRGRREWTRYGMVVSAYVIAGELAKAEEALAEAYALVARQEARGHEPTLLRLEGELLTRKGSDADRALDRYARALSMAQELGMRPEVAHCHVGLARLYHRTGKPQEAQEHLAAAITMYREMDMRYWLEKAETGDAR